MKNLKFAFLGLAALLAVTLFVLSIDSVRKERTSDLSKNRIEAYTSCSVEKGNKTVYLCTGDKEQCSVTYLGVTLTCSGKEANSSR